MKNVNEESKNGMRGVISLGRRCKVNYPLRVVKNPRDIYATRIVDNTGKINYLVNAK